jgi:hypothetical protein
MKLAQAPNRNYFWRAAFSLVLAQKHHLAIVISEANTAKTFVCDPLAKLQGLGIAQVHGPFRKLLMELDHERFVFRANRTNRNGFPILHSPG